MNYEEALQKLNKLPKGEIMHAIVRTVGDAISFIEYLQETNGKSGEVFEPIAKEIERLLDEHKN